MNTKIIGTKFKAQVCLPSTENEHLVPAISLTIFKRSSFLVKLDELRVVAAFLFPSTSRIDPPVKSERSSFYIPKNTYLKKMACYTMLFKRWNNIGLNKFIDK